MTRSPKAAFSATLMGAAFLALAGCASSGGRQTSRVDYVCDNGERVTVVFQPNTARIISVQPAVEMQRQRTASGFHFASAQNSIRGQGRQMTWTRGFAAPLNCREVNRR
jgi:hypothetical protein